MTVAIDTDPRAAMKPVTADVAGELANLLLDQVGLDDIRASIAVGAITKGQAWTTNKLTNDDARRLVHLVESGQVPPLDSPLWKSEVDQRLNAGCAIPARVLNWRQAQT